MPPPPPSLSISSTTTRTASTIAETTTLMVIFLLLLATSSTISAQDSDQESSDCTNKRIHIRHLPPQFNLDLLANCSAYPLFDDFCNYLPNHGLGQKTHNKSHSWYRTDPFMLELIFHRRMLEYPCLTSDPTIANAIYIPYYAGIDSLRYLFGPEYNNSFQHGLDLFHYLVHLDSPSIWGRNFGHDHFLVMARSAWDFIQPLNSDPLAFGTSFLELPEFYNVTALTLEARAYPWQERAVPYPTSFHPPSVAFLEAWIRRVKRSRRSTLMMFAGGGGYSQNPNIRRSIRLECDAASNMTVNGTGYAKMCEFVDCSNGVCEHDPIRFMKPILQASFCLQPPGDTPTRRSTFDGIIGGCIPVFFDDLTAKKQYGWHMEEEKYGEFSVFIPKEDVVFKGVKILDVLMSIPRAEVRRMREKILELIPGVMYRKHGSSLGLRSIKDAFDIAIEGVLQRIQSRLEEVAAQ